MPAALVAAVAIAASPAAAPRHVIAGHFRVPRVAGAHRLGNSANVVTNGDFESGYIDGGWHQCGDTNAEVTVAHPFSGKYSEYSGTRSGRGEPRGNSGVCQQVTIPANGVLTAELYQLSDETETTFAYQEADLLDNRGNVVVNLYRSVNHTAAWVRGTWNLSAYAGRTFWLYFGVHGDGYPNLATQQFVDEVTLAPRRE
jgi:hypothetical protein